MANSNIVRVVPSGFTAYFREAEVYDSTLQKIKENHPAEYERLDDVYDTIQGFATSIHFSKTSSTSIILVNNNCTSNTSGAPLRVPVKVFSDGTAIMTSAYFSSSKDQGSLIWSTGAGAVVPVFVGRERGK